ncbi:MAG TPA: peptidoglycan DD-metalloendopeptidase family protein [Puia sp.]|jgi:murein DD-endopeptidase MepM/ murein hydrolase activator NlpD|nr:peptidoglycan DD-metalloendopeptidase family protein [Puia sp.]
MSPLTDILRRHRADYHSVVPFEAARDRLYVFDFTEHNTGLSPDDVADTERFAVWINRTLQQHKARYGFGGYGEHRTLYARSKHFDQGGEPRRLHLGIDIWGPAGTRVMAPLDGIVHSFAFNNNDSDYGATLILTHHLEGIGFHTLFGHLSLNSLKNLYEGRQVSKGEVIAEFGMRFENGNWPPHLHFQCIADMQGRKGDYPGVCRFSERSQWLDNCPDPDLILHMSDGGKD